jgi:hypothetical protein
MLKRIMSGLLLTAVRGRIVAWSVLLLLVVMLFLGACAGPTQTSTPAPTPSPTPTLESTPAPSQILTLEPSANPTLQIADLAINPPQVSPGERATISANFTNTSDTEDSYTVELFINDVVEVVKEVTIPSGQTRELRFSEFFETPGTYRVNLGELTGQFVIVESGELAQSSTPGCCSGAPDSSTSDSSGGRCGSGCGCG